MIATMVGGRSGRALSTLKIRGPATMTVAPVNDALLIKVVWDCLKRVVRWSPRAESVFGWTAEEVLGKRFDEWPFIAAADLSTAREAMVRVTSDSERRDFIRLQHIRKNGAPLWCEWHNYSITSERGDLVCILSYGVPIAEP